MFTGIIEATGIVEEVAQDGTNFVFTLSSPISQNLKADQSIAHDGVCLTVTKVMDGMHTVTAIAETLDKSNLSFWEKGKKVNLERCLEMNGRLDGHFVQGHVDTTAKCILKEDKNGSWEFGFEIDEKFAHLIVEKGSISLNGISLTIFNVKQNSFHVAIIPYTIEHTNIGEVGIGDKVNIEFDIIGKYIFRKQEVSAK